MSTLKKSNFRYRRGFAYVLAMVLLAIFSTLAVAFASSTDLGLRKSDNCRRIGEARLAAEGGLEFAIHTMRDVLSEGTWGQQPDMIPIVFNHLSGKLNGTSNLGGQTVSMSCGVISVPGISLSDDASFSFTVVQAGADQLRLTVTGYSGSCTRTVAIKFNIQEDTTVTNYTVASRSRVFITDNAVVDGDVFSTWTRTNIWKSGEYSPPFKTQEGTTVNGKLKTVMSQPDFDEYNSGDYINGEDEGLDYNEPEFAEYTTEDFDTTDYKTGTTNITTLDPPDYWLNQEPFPNPDSIRRKIDRPVYENRTFDNVYIPVGHNPKFINCTFNRIIYVDTNETTTLEEWSHGYYNQNCIPGKESYSDDPTNEHSNNVVFEGCTFNGPVITAVARDYWWTKNALTFEGETTFANEYMPESTILAPNFGVDIGGRGYDSETNPDSKLTGVIVGGIVDIRGSASVEGTILSMHEPGTDYGSSAWYYGTNIGYAGLGGEEGDAGVPGNIRLVPQPGMELPFGMRKKYTITVVPESYEEPTQ